MNKGICYIIVGYPAKNGDLKIRKGYKKLEDIPSTKRAYSIYTTTDRQEFEKETRFWIYATALNYFIYEGVARDQQELKEIINDFR